MQNIFHVTAAMATNFMYYHWGTYIVSVSLFQMCSNEKMIQNGYNPTEKLDLALGCDESMLTLYINTRIDLEHWLDALKGGNSKIRLNRYP